MFVLWDSTPAQNTIYSSLDSNGTRHIKNIPLEAPPVKGARRRGLGPRQTDVWPRRPSLLKSLAEVRPARINRLKDKKGILHITSVRSSPEFKPPAVGQLPPSRQAKKQGEPQSPGITQHAKASGSRPDGHDDPAANPGAGANNPEGAGRAELPTANVAATNGAEEFCSLEQLNPDGAYEGVSRMALFVDQHGKMYIFRSKVEVLDSPGPETARWPARRGLI